MKRHDKVALGKLLKNWGVFDQRMQELANCIRLAHKDEADVRIFSRKIIHSLLEGREAGAGRGGAAYGHTVRMGMASVCAPLYVIFLRTGELILWRQFDFGDGRFFCPDQLNTYFCAF